MTILSAKESKEVDILTMEKYNILGIELMENAGQALAEKIASISEGGAIGIICGKGNNGGDGLACGVKLKEMGLYCELFLPTSAALLSNDSKYFYSICLRLGIPMKLEASAKDLNLNHLDIVVDGLLGIGISGKVRSEYGEWIELINNFEGEKISIDIPSGINATNGDISGSAVKANKTVAMGFLKQGLVIQPGKFFAGKVEIAELGYPKEVFKDFCGVNIINESFVYDCIKPTEVDTYKQKQGKLLIVAGSRGFTGAAILSANAAMRTGAGLVLVVVPKSVNDTMEKNLIEPITFPVEDNGKGFLDESGNAEIKEKLDWCDAILIGPGLGVDQDLHKVVKFVIDKSTKPILIDADAITHMSNDIKLLKKKKNQIILTPHYGEASRIFNVDLKEIRKDPFSFVRNAAEKSGSIVVLKGASTLIAMEDKVLINKTGHQGLATAGTGDVLAGIMGSFLCQGFSAKEASKLAVFIHGKCADKLLGKKGYRGLIASDLIDVIPSVLANYELGEFYG
ncbi:MAG: hypothetical protein CMG75_09645 [Candidatus Marinimicrobia bacterium]|nr:hypothetical protein [Candidatus Neomarinimicrobiota bacterium]|tara:strand:- start:14810 stop:16345 length:1536 start_codon:yes stop_codon:yes gene_type:complete